MSVDPAYGHYRIVNLGFEKFNFAIISHAALILLSSLLRHNQSVDYKTAVSLYASEDRAGFYFCGCVWMCDLEKSCDYVDWANNCA